MHIKQITISNFRSFRQQLEIQPFSSGTNSVVGRNGSGKSNLFDAVQFVLLAPRFANLRQEERQALLHEGSGSAAVSAYVEICFDNSDGRFALESSDEVVLRRTVGLKKDEFFLQRKRAQKQEIQSLLEGAGFSKSNPYYIVQQGKVQGLCTMSDSDRLRLLHEVAGTLTYDEKKAESLIKMQENINSIEKIQQILSDIENRLSELQSEKEELIIYQKLDRERRALEYCVYDKELRKARTILDQIEYERTEFIDNVVSDVHEQARQTHNAIRNIESTLKSKTSIGRRNRIQIESLEDDKKHAITVYTKLRLACKELTETIRSAEELQKSNDVELKELRIAINKTQTELDHDIQPAYDEITQTLQDMKNKRDEANHQIEALYAKQGRGKQFTTKQERDQYLKKNLKELETAKIEKETELDERRDLLANIRRTIEKEVKDIDRSTQQVTEHSANLQTLTKTINDKKHERIQIHDARKEDWRQLENIRDQVREARDNMHRAISDTRKAMPRSTAMGLEALRSVVEQEDLVVGEQYFGMLMENLTLTDPKYETAVEVASQNSLFHVIVDTDQTAARLMKRLEDGKLGRVTFLPLNQLRIDDATYPDNNNDVRPLLDLCIKYDRKVERAMRHVFARKLIARNAEIASNMSSKYSMDAITLDGDLCGRKGAMTGGYIDTSKSRLRAHNKEIETKQILKKIEQQYTTLNQHIQDIENNVSNLMHEIQRLEAKHTELSHIVSSKETDIERMKMKHTNHKNQITKIEKTVVPALERDINVLNADINRLQDEMGTELVQTLSDADRKLLNDLKELQEKLTSEIDIQSEKVAEVGVQRHKLQSLLNDNLLKRQREITEGLPPTEEDDGGGGAGESESASTGRGGRGRGRVGGGRGRIGGGGNNKSRISSAAILAETKDELELKQRELDGATNIKNDIETRLKNARNEEEKLRTELITSKNELEQLKSKDMDNMKKLEESKNESERLLNKRSMCISKRETYIRKIQELGSLPPPAELEKFSGRRISDLMKLLEQVNKKLKKYSHVNKKAYDQYVNFGEQRESLLQRKDELDRGAEKVQELIDSLDRQKDEAINRTFRGVSAHFKDVFKELVPNGAGELIMRTTIQEEEDETNDNDKDNDDDDEENDSPESQRKKKKQKRDGHNSSGNSGNIKNPDISLFCGVGIKVRFSEIGENFLMSQLSGGQKALVALSLIFAIQRCDPAPFYLFDELDQALDSTYRSAVANLVQRQANSIENPTQFIVSTFRPELVSVANRCYGISHQNKVSSLHSLAKKDALHFVANLMNEEEAVGEVTTISTSQTRNGAGAGGSAGNNNRRRGPRNSSNSKSVGRKARDIEETTTIGDDDEDVEMEEAEDDTSEG